MGEKQNQAFAAGARGRTYFESEKAKAVAIQTTLSQTDKAIDEMVYALYGLTEEEIKIVETKN